MATRAQVLALLDSGHSFETAGRALDIPAGRAFMIATGLPADRSDTPHPDELHDQPRLPATSQHLVNPPPLHPTGNDQVIRWVQDRAARQLTQPE